MKLLRPNGYFQWEEFDPMALKLHTSEGKAEILEKLVDSSQTRVPTRLVLDLIQIYI